MQIYDSDYLSLDQAVDKIAEWLGCSRAIAGWMLLQYMLWNPEDVKVETVNGGPKDVARHSH